MNDEIVEFIQAVRQICRYWETHTENTKDAAEGTAHSILCLIDGVSSRNGARPYTLTIGDAEVTGEMLHEMLYSEAIK